MKINKRSEAVILILSGWLFGFGPCAYALKIPTEVKSALVKILPVERVRIDGAVETKNENLYLPLIPVKSLPGTKGEASLKVAFPNRTVPDVLLFDNGWCFLRIINKDKQQTVVSLDTLSADLQKAILATRLASDLIVPKNFFLPSSMKIVVGSVAVPLQNMVPSSSDAQTLPKIKNYQPANAAISHGEACIVVTSPATGKVSLLAYPTLEKIIEFPMDGTPSGIAYANGKVYITDQSKGRILKLDPYRKVFLGQIDLPKGSTPKDVAALPNGKLIYVSENMFSDIAVFETDSDKLLVRTKVNNYPGKMVLSGDGSQLLILSVPDSKLSIISTQNQRFLGTIAVGSLPSGLAINDNGKTAYVSSRVSNTVSVVDLIRRSVTLSLKTGIGPTGVAIDANKRLYVANAKDNSITVFDLTNYKKISDIKLPLDLDFPNSLTFLPDKKSILVSSASTDAIGLFNTVSQSFEKIKSIGHNSDQCLWVPAQ